MSIQFTVGGKILKVADKRLSELWRCLSGGGGGGGGVLGNVPQENFDIVGPQRTNFCKNFTAAKVIVTLNIYMYLVKLVPGRTTCTIQNALTDITFIQVKVLHVHVPYKATSVCLSKLK